MGTQREVGWERQRRMWEVLSPKPAEPLDCLVPWVSKCPFLLMSMWLSFIARRSLMQWGRAHSSIIWQSFVETDNTPGTGQYLCALKGPRHRLKINNKKNCSTRSKTPNYRARLLVNEERPLSHILKLVQRSCHRQISNVLTFTSLSQRAVTSTIGARTKRTR